MKDDNDLKNWHEHLEYHANNALAVGKEYRYPVRQDIFPSWMKYSNASVASPIQTHNVLDLLKGQQGLINRLMIDRREAELFGASWVKRRLLKHLMSLGKATDKTAQAFALTKTDRDIMRGEHSALNTIYEFVIRNSKEWSA